MANRRNISIFVNHNLERALKQIKKKIEREGIVKEMKKSVYYEPPTQKRRKRRLRAVKQNYLRMLQRGL